MKYVASISHNRIHQKLQNVFQHEAIARYVQNHLNIFVFVNLLYESYRGQLLLP